MKKIILVLLFFLTSAIGYSQVIDTSIYSFVASNVDGKYYGVTNKVSLYGEDVGAFVYPLSQIINFKTIDTAIWGWVKSKVDGKIIGVYNKATFYGEAINSFRVDLTYQMDDTSHYLSVFSFDTSRVGALELRTSDTITLSLYNANGTKWLYFNGADSSININGSNFKLIGDSNNIGIGNNSLQDINGNYNIGFGNNALYQAVGNII